MKEIDFGKADHILICDQVKRDFERGGYLDLATFADYLGGFFNSLRRSNLLDNTYIDRKVDDLAKLNGKQMEVEKVKIFVLWQKHVGRWRSYGTISKIGRYLEATDFVGRFKGLDNSVNIFFQWFSDVYISFILAARKDNIPFELRYSGMYSPAFYSRLSGFKSIEDMSVKMKEITTFLPTHSELKERREMEKNLIGKNFYTTQRKLN